MFYVRLLPGARCIRAFRLHKHSDDERREFWIMIEFGEAPPLLKWALMLGDALHSYRVALDHVTWEIAVRHNYPDPPPKPKRATLTTQGSTTG